ncbi:MAG: hypothetical protein KDK53_14055 [Maritimibacter sp.]|nr:hypothetical protein [Maritimibacter sp.]
MVFVLVSARLATTGAALAGMRNMRRHLQSLADETMPETGRLNMTERASPGMHMQMLRKEDANTATQRNYDADSGNGALV